jgi:hypothetical protein
VIHFWVHPRRGVRDCGEKWGDTDIAWEHVADEEYGVIDAKKKAEKM